MKKRVLSFALCCCMVMSLLAGFTAMAGEEVAVTGIQTAGMTKIKVGETVKWTASVVPANATDQFLYWTAGNPAVATVDQTGKITGLRNGQCHITVTAKNGVKKTLLLTVGEIAVTGIQTAGMTKIEVGETVKWTASVLPANATDQRLHWTAGNPAVATVDQTGKITGLRNGQCNITVTAANGVKKTLLLTVGEIAVTGIQTAGMTKIEVGETVKWTASVLPANATDQRLHWTAGNPAVATVDQTGKITGLRNGQCNITVTAANGVKKTLLLTVGEIAVTGIQTAGKTQLNAGESVKWTASVLPASASNKSLWWTAGNPGVAAVDQNGIITAKRAGQCNITITAANGVKKTLLVTVAGSDYFTKNEIPVRQSDPSELPLTYANYMTGNRSVYRIKKDGTFKVVNCTVVPSKKEGYKEVTLQADFITKLWDDKEYGQLLSTNFAFGFYDYFTGVEFPGRDMQGEDGYEYSYQLNVNGTVYDIAYNYSTSWTQNEWIWEGTANHYSEGIAHLTASFRVPNNYYGLVMSVAEKTDLKDNPKRSMNNDTSYALDDYKTGDVFFRFGNK